MKESKSFLGHIFQFIKRLLMNLIGKSSLLYTPDYGTSVVYLGGNDKIRPINDFPAEGFFSAEPNGLEINQRNGEIDLSQSDTGICYRILFTNCDKQETSTWLTISGINYESKVYSLSRGETQVKPFYNSKLQTPPPDQGSVFDTRGTAQKQGLIIDPKTGWIDLIKTIEQGACGFRESEPGSGRIDLRIPTNGASKEFEMYYSLQDDSKGTPNKITLRIHYYDSEEDIPDEVRDRYQWKRDWILNNCNQVPLLAILAASLHIDFGDGLWGAVATLLAALSSFAFLMPTAPKQTTMKPPDIIVTR
jgi:hypothetical protein